MSVKKFITGKKIGMTQIITDSGKIIPCTVVEAFENEILKTKTIETDGYNAIVIGFNRCDEKKLNRPCQKMFKSKVFYKSIKEFRVDSIEAYNDLQSFQPDDFTLNDLFDVQSKTIGRGFSGAIKAWNHSCGPKSHGSKNKRLLGSIGQATTPGNVKKGKQMHTRYGNEKVTIKNLELVLVKENKYLFFKGAIPGKNGLVTVLGK